MVYFLHMRRRGIMQEQSRFGFITEKFKRVVDPQPKEVSFPTELPVDEIMPNPYQPRRHFDVTALEELADSIRQVGIITPVSVRRAACGYELICGERRLRAAKIVGLKKIPAIIMDISDRESAVVAITENLQRKDLSFFEAAESMKNLIEFHGVTQEQVAEKLGKSQAAVANKLRLLKLPESVKRAVNEGNLCERHARALLRLPREEMQLEAVRHITDGELNVSEAEKLIQKMLSEEPQRRMVRREATTFENRRRLFKNTLMKTLDMLKKGGLATSVSENENEKYIEYTIKLEKT